MSVAVGAGGRAGRSAAADRDVGIAVPMRRGHGVDDVAPLGVAERWTRLVDHRRSPVRLDDNRRAAELATRQARASRRSPSASSMVDGNAAEPAGERADEAGRRAERHRGPADVHRLAARRDRDVGGARAPDRHQARGAGSCGRSSG